MKPDYYNIFFNSNNKPKAYYFIEKNLLNKYPNIYNEVISFSNNLNCISFSQKLYHFLKDITEIPKCSICNNDCNYTVFSIGYKKTCNNKSCNNKLSQISRETNNLIKYNKKNVFELDSVKEKVKNFQFEKYGNWQLTNKELDYKQNRTIEKEILRKEKTLNTNLKKYNELDYFPRKHTKQILFERFKNNFISKYSKDYNIININQNREIEILCNKCNKNYRIDYYLFYLRKLYNNNICLNCRPLNKSHFELDMVDFLNDNNINFIRNTKSIIKDNKQKYELDFYLIDYNIAIEINDFHSHTELDKSKKYHLLKTELCNKKGISLIHLFQDEWLLKRDIVKSRILNLVNKTPNKIYARKTIIKEVNNKDSKIFLEENHLQGNTKDSINIGLYYNNELLSLMTFGKPSNDRGFSKDNKNSLIELKRFCNKLNYNIIGGASKLFKYYVTNYKPEKIISYADRNWTNDYAKSVYKKLDFNYIGVTSIGYSYVKLKNNELNKDYSNLKKYPRFKFNRKLARLLFNEKDLSLTEYEIMNKNGFFRIYNTGNLKFEIVF